MNQIPPLAHLGIGEVGCLAELARLGLRKVLRLLRPPLPELERAEEVRAGHAEARMRLVRLLLLVDRTAPRIVAGHGGDEREDGRQHGVAGGGEQHAREARLHRDLRELAADVGQDDLSRIARSAIPTIW